MPSHPTAVIHPSVDISRVEVGPHVVIEENVSFGEGCRIAAGAVIRQGTVLGANNFIGEHALLGGDPQDLSFDPDTKSGVRIGDNNVIREQVTIHRSTKAGVSTIIGDNNFLMAVSHIAHDSILGSHIIIANNSLVAGHVRIDDYAFISGNCAIHQFCRVGQRSMCGGIAKIVQDIPPYTTVDGNPAVYKGLNSVGLKRAGFKPEQRNQIKAVYETVYDRSLDKNAILDRLQAMHDNPFAVEIRDFISSSQRGIIIRK